jgi:hypothetical protein
MERIWSTTLAGFVTKHQWLPAVFFSLKTDEDLTAKSRFAFDHAKLDAETRARTRRLVSSKRIRPAEAAQLIS